MAGTKVVILGHLPAPLERESPPAEGTALGTPRHQQDLPEATPTRPVLAIGHRHHFRFGGGFQANEALLAAVAEGAFEGRLRVETLEANPGTARPNAGAAGLFTAFEALSSDSLLLKGLVNIEEEAIEAHLVFTRRFAAGIPLLLLPEYVDSAEAFPTTLDFFILLEMIGAEFVVYAEHRLDDQCFVNT